MASGVVDREEIISSSDQNLNVIFPVEVHFPDGNCEIYESPEDLELNLEFFDPAVDVGCEVRDAEGRPVRLKVDKLQIKTLEVLSTR